MNAAKYLRSVTLEDAIRHSRSLRGKSSESRIYPLWPHKFVSPSQWWMVAAGQATKKSPWTVMVGLALWQQYRFNHLKQPLKLTHHTLHSWGIKKLYARRALIVLEKAGLITVQRFKHRSPLITLVTGQKDGQQKL
jgi:hypothetical protein